MATFYKIIRGGTLVLKTGEVKADLGIDDERIAAIEPTLDADAEEVVDASGLHVFPGVIDSHVHFNDPGRADWEGFSSGTRALAAGGATCFFDMPLNSVPPTVDAVSFKEKVTAARGRVHVDFALWGGLVPGNVHRLDELAECGVIGFKAFMADTGIEEFAAADDLTLYEGMGRAAKLGLPVAVHAENGELVGRLAARARREGRTAATDFLDSRPMIAELEAIQRALLFAAETRCAIHIVHVSTSRGVRAVVEAQSRGVDVSCETCPHYLVLDAGDLDALGASAKCAPPLRDAIERASLRHQVVIGAVDIVASDHSPAPASLKEGTDFFQIWGGISGCQSLLQLMLTEGSQGGLTSERIADLTASRPAERFGLSRRKGQIQVGVDADLVLVDTTVSQEVRREDLHYRHAQSPYIGRVLRGQIIRTLLRGETIYHRGAFCSPPSGKLITPDSSQATTEARLRSAAAPSMSPDSSL